MKTNIDTLKSDIISITQRINYRLKHKLSIYDDQIALTTKQKECNQAGIDLMIEYKKDKYSNIKYVTAVRIDGDMCYIERT